MGDNFAIAAVTATLAYILESNGITVQTIPPDQQQTQINPKLNIFLYQVSPNMGYNNSDLPTRSYFGKDFLNKPQIGLDLCYLLTCYGANNYELSAQKTLAEVIRVLHEHPFLDRSLITDAIKSFEDRNLFPGIGSTDLVKQAEIIKLTMQNLSLEDLTKIWSSFVKEGSYRISVAYKATVVLLDSKEEPKIPLPVKHRNFYTVPAQIPPHIINIDPSMVTWRADPLHPEDSDWNEITINGTSLNATDVRIDFGEDVELDALPKPVYVDNNKITFQIPPTTPSGIKQVRIIHPFLIGTHKKLHRYRDSNTVLFALVPSITSTSSESLTVGPWGARLSVQFEPALHAGQTVKVIIGTFKQLEPTAAVTSGSNSVEVIIPTKIEAGTYPIRIAVDGAESQPDKKKWQNEYERPFVNITKE